MDAGPELEVHHHSTGHRWIDIVLGVSAVAISLLSAVLTFQHGDAMEHMVQQNARMVQANTWPFVSVGDGNRDSNGHPVYRIFLINSGVGPAKIGSLTITYKGERVRDVSDLARRVATDTHIPGSASMTGSNPGGVLPARQSVTLMNAQRPESSPELINAFDRARDEIDVHVCYCSIFDDCWVAGFQMPQPRPVKQCDSDRKIVITHPDFIEFRGPRGLLR